MKTNRILATLLLAAPLTFAPAVAGAHSGPHDYGTPSCSAKPSKVNGHGYITNNSPDRHLQIWTGDRMVYNDVLKRGETTPGFPPGAHFLWAGTWYRFQDALDACSTDETTTTTAPTTTSTTQPEPTTTTTAPTTTTTQPTTTTTQPTTTTTQPTTTTTQGTTSTSQATTSTTQATTSTTQTGTRPTVIRTTAPAPTNLGSPVTAAGTCDPDSTGTYRNTVTGMHCSRGRAGVLAHTGAPLGLLVGAGVSLSAVGAYLTRRFGRRS